MPVGYSIYQEKESPIHQIDPRAKMAVLGSIFLLVLAFNNPFFHLLPVLFIVVVAVVAKLDLKTLQSSLLGAGWIFVLSLVLWPLSIPEGNVVFRVLGSPVTDTGILFGVAMGLRVSVMVVAATVWMMVTSPQHLTQGLLKLGLPYKAGIALSSAIRFIPLINAERATIVEAQQARGLQFRGAGIMSRIFRSGRIIGPLFLRSIELAQSLALALDARGFGARDGRTNLYSISMGRMDRFIIWASVAVVVVSWILRLLGVGVLLPGHL